MMRSLSVAINDELNEGNFLGTGGFDAAAMVDACILHFN